MPRNPRRNTEIEGRQDIRSLAVYVAEDAETDPVEADRKLDMSVVRVSRGANERMTSAVIEVDLGKASVSRQRPIQDVRLHTGLNLRCEIWTLRETVNERNRDSQRERCLFRGEIYKRQLLVANGSEKYVLTAGLKPYHFGDLCRGQEQYNSLTDDTETIPTDLEFNPQIDTVICPNMLPAAGDEDEGDTNNNPNDYPIWVDPEAVRTERAYQFQGNPQSWGLKEIVHALSSVCNPTESHVKNPDVELLGEQLSVLITPPVIKNLVVARGAHLCDYLTEILPRYGFGWFPQFVPTADDEQIVDTTIVIYQRGQGLEKTVKLQRFGETFDAAETNIDGLDVSYDVSTLANKLYVEGSREERQVTVRLYPGWNFTVHDVIDNRKRSNPAFRLWVGNEAGDYKGLNATHDAGDPPNLLVNYSVPRRRVIEDNLAYFPGTTTRQPPILEYSTDAGVTWQKVDRHKVAYSLLPDQIGIYFTAENEAGTSVLPDEFNETDPDLLQFRITGTVVDSVRINDETILDTDSPNSLRVPRLIDASDQFHFRNVEASADDYDFADEVDDQTALETYADTLLEQEKAAQVEAKVSIPGLVFDYEIGDIITKVEGREISFNRLVETAVDEEEIEDGRYLQVVGVTYHNQVGRQSTELKMEPYDI